MHWARSTHVKDTTIGLVKVWKTSLSTCFVGANCSYQQEYAIYDEQIPSAPLVKIVSYT